MKRSDSNNGASTLAWLLPVGLIVVAVIVYFKIKSDDAVELQQMEQAVHRVDGVAVPDTTLSTDAFDLTEENASIAVCDSVGRDTRPAMEAGDEDGYWDGWYDGAETGQRQRYDESCSFTKPEDRRIYAESYREGYEKGFDEAMSKRVVNTKDSLS